MALLTRKRTVYIKQESSAYQYAFSSDPVTADYVPAFDASYAASGDLNKNLEIRPDFQSLSDFPSSGMAKVSWKSYLRGGASAGVAGLLSRPLLGCGFSETIVAVTSVTYKPISNLTTIGNPFSVLLIEDGVGYGISGAFGTAKFNFEAGKQPFIEFEFSGAYQAIAAKTAPTGPTTPPVPPTFYNAQMSIPPTWTAEFEKFLLDCSTQLGDVMDANASETNSSVGYKGKVITGRDITGSIDPTAVAPATKDVFGVWKAGTAAQVQTGVIGSVAGNRYQITLALVQYTKPPSLAERNGYRTFGIDFAAKVAANAADGDVLSIAFT